MGNERKQMARCFDKVSSVLNDLSVSCDMLLDGREQLENEISFLQDKLERAAEYYSAARNELRLVLELCAASRAEIPLEGHFMEINDLVPETDPQRGRYMGDWLDESFTCYV